MKLRPYQQQAIEALFQFFSAHAHPDENPVVAMPTGTGKSAVIAAFCHQVLSWWPGQRILMLVHVKELVEQNGNTLKRIWPQAPLGIFSSGLRRRESHLPITFAGVKSVASNLALFGRQDIIVIDEAHLVSEEEESEYGKVLAYFRALNPLLRIVGLSATPYRMGLGLITDGRIFSHTAYDVTGLTAFNHLLDEGYLCPIIPMRTSTVIDVAGVAKRGGEFVAGQLQQAVNREHLTRAALREAVVAAKDRDHWLIFAAGVDHVNAIHEMLTTEFGITATRVHGKMGDAERDEALRSFKAGEVRACVNANILTTGFDFPALDCIICLRPTNSTVLHIQMLGRLTRPFYADGFDLDTAEGRRDAIDHSSKRNGLVLDFAGNVMRLGPVNDPRIPKRKGEGKGDIPVKVCDNCGCMNHISARTCDNCGEEFPIEEKITERASTAELIAKVEPPKVLTFDVSHVVYSRHSSPGKPDMLKVSYYCGVQMFTELVLLEHYGSLIHRKAQDWWRKRSPEPVPASVREAIGLERSLATPRTVNVWVNKKVNGKIRPEVMDHGFQPQETQQ